jgi:hypothetical protein
LFFFCSQSGDDHPWEDLAKSGYNPCVTCVCVCVCFFFFFSFAFFFIKLSLASIPRGNLALNGDRFLEPVKKLLVKKSATQLKVKSKCGGKRNNNNNNNKILEIWAFSFFFQRKGNIGKGYAPFYLFFLF